MKTIVWIATNADGRRWELWLENGSGKRNMLGRLFIDLYGDGKTSVGWFVQLESKRGRAAMKSTTGRKPPPRYSWKEQKAETLAAGAELLVEKTVPPVCICCKTRHRRGENPDCLITQGRAPECVCYLPSGEHYSGCMKRRWDALPTTLLGSRHP